MSIGQPFLRRRVSVRRMASVCSVFAVLPLMGCGSSFESAYDFAGRGRNIGLQSKADIKPESDVAKNDVAKNDFAKSGIVQSYSTVPTSGTFGVGRVQRASLAPLAEPAGSTAGAAPLSGGYLLGAADTGAAPASGQTPVRLANNYATRRQPQPYVRDDSDYGEADRARRGDYAAEPPQPRYRKDESRLQETRAEPAGGGDYIVQRGDTLYGIAERHGLTVGELSGLNGLTGAEIRPGQRLRVEGRPQPYAAPAPREARPYRAPEPAPAPYRERQAEPRGDYREAPAANLYQPRYQGEQRYDPRRAPEPAYGQDRAIQERVTRERVSVERVPVERQPTRAPREAYDEPRGYEPRQPDYTASSTRYTANGPFPPSPDAPWRGEAEWRRMGPPDGASDPDAFEPQIEADPRGGRRAPPPPQAYEPRPAYEAQPPRAAPAPYAQREPYPSPSSRGRAPGGYVYTVRRGDTLNDIARRNGVDLRELADHNGLPANARLNAGQEIRVPRGGEDWTRGRPAPEAGYQAAPPLRQRAAIEAPRAAEAARAVSAREPRQSAAPVEASRIQQAQPQPQRMARAAEPAPRRHAETVEDPALAKASLGSEPQHAPRAPEPAQAPAQPVEATDVEVNAPVNTAAATAHAVTERTGTRECEALLASPEPRTAKTFRQPVQGMVVAKFGSQDDGSFNDGINFAVPKGTPVKAAENGVVAYAGDELAGFGNLVLIRHADGYVTAYAHNDELLVRKCDVVKRGQIISKAGASGKAAAPQLHFELRKDSKPMDPDGHFSGT